MPRMRVSRAQKKTSGSAIDFVIGIDAVLESLAAGFALANSMTDRRYLDAIVDEAFETAEKEFNIEAAAMGKTGAISHMFEWGTLGINKGRTNVRLDPMSPSARLWNNFNEGSGLDRTLWFMYRPSVATVPKPTSGATGMSTETIRKMRDHVFRWKAEVMEEGQTVTISRKRAKFLLIPAYEQNRPYMRPHDIKRGYALTKGPITADPGGARFQGSFTSFWIKFWEGRGDEIVEASVNAQILSDYQPELVKPRTSNTLRPVGTFEVKSLVATKAKKIQSRVNKKARARRIK